MNHLIKIYPADIHYTQPVDTTLLDAALTAKINLQHSCKQGSCGVCVADILDGCVMNEHGDVVSSGSVLTCRSYATSDVSLKAHYYPELSAIECLTLPCRVSQCEFVKDDIVLLTLRIPPTARWNYLPGQYLDLMYGGVRRSYSIANAVSDEGLVELHIRLLSDGVFSQLLKQITPNQLMRMEGPKGTFFVRSSVSPIIFLAGGTGFAPVKAMVEGLLRQGTQREIYIYWGATASAYFYMNTAAVWASEHEHVHYVPVVSSEDPSWAGRRGFVHQAVVDDFDDLSDYHVYACGSLAMISAAKAALIAKGLVVDHFYSDAFVPSI